MPISFSDYKVKNDLRIDEFKERNDKEDMAM